MGLWVWVLAAGAAAAEPRTDHVLSGPREGYGESVTVRWSLTLVNRSDVVLPRPEIRCLVPVRQTSTQLCRSVRASECGSLSEDAFGNQVLACRTPDLPPLGRARIAFSAALDLASEPVPIPANRAGDGAGFLAPEAGIESDAPAVLALATSLVGDAGSSGDRTAAFSSWIASSLQHTGYNATDRGALWALAKRGGDCSDYAALLTALCRAGGIPARRVLGVALPASGGAIARGDLHVWVEVLPAEGWRPLDPLKRLSAVRRPVAFALLAPESLPVTALSSKLFLCDSADVEVRLDT